MSRLIGTSGWMRTMKAVLVSILFNDSMCTLFALYVNIWRCFGLGAGDMDMGGMGGMDFSVCL